MNVIFRGILGSPLHGMLSSSLLILTFTGRKSKLSYTFPVAYVEQDGTILITTNRPWHKNLQDGRPVGMRIRGSWVRGTPTVISDEAGMAAAYRTILSRSPRLGKFIGLSLDAQGEPRPDELARARANGWVVIAIKPA